MAKSPVRNKTSFGVLNGYASDAAYLADITGTNPKRGDSYYNTTVKRYRYYDGTSWVNSSPTQTTTVRLIDHTLVAVPSGAQTVDGQLTSPGDLVILAAYDNKVYQASVGAWTLQAAFANGDTPTEAESIYVKEGTVYQDFFLWFDGSSWRIINPLKEGSAVGAIPYWNGTYWSPDNQLLANGSQLNPPANAIADAAKATNLTVSAANKTAGTGDGGDFYLNGGTSVGGEAGRVRLSALSLRFSTPNTPLTPLDGDLVYQANDKFKYYNGTAWKLLYPLPTGTFQQSTLIWDGLNWVENPVLKLISGTLTANDNAINDGSSAANLSLAAPNKTAGTGGGGGIFLTSGGSVGGAAGDIEVIAGNGQVGGKIKLKGGFSNLLGTYADIWLNNLRVSTPYTSDPDTTLFLPDESTANATKAPDLTVRASNKTAGTGDGGDLKLNAGTSIGGTKGDVLVDGNKTVFTSGGTQTLDLRSDRWLMGPIGSQLELLHLQTFNVLPSQTDQPVFSIPDTYRSAIVEAQIFRNGHYGTVTIHMANNGVTATAPETGSETGDTGVAFTADILAGQMRLLYTSDASGPGTVKYHVRRWQ